MTSRARLEFAVLLAHLLALCLVLGAPLFFGAVVAPASFRVLPTRDLAAALASPIVTRLCWLMQGGFAVLLLTCWLLSRRWNAPRGLRALVTRAPVLGVIGAVVIEKLLIPPIDRIRAEAPGLLDNLPAADPGRLLLQKYHRLATGFFAVEIAAAALLLLLTARLLLLRRAAPGPPAAARPPAPKVLDLDGV
ncbi:MAG: DUF4149 domain-containing protein [Thermoanaerobaculia bacterium]